MTKKLLVVGQGYVGLPISMRAISVGYMVVGLDNDESRVAKLLAGNSFVEDVSSESLKEALLSRRYNPTSDSDEAVDFDVAVITVPTPLREGAPDLSYIVSAAQNLAPFVRKGCVVVLESTTYPGTTEELMVPILEAGSGLTAGTDFYVGYSPERIDPGNPVWNFVNTPKVVSGVNAESLQEVGLFYKSLVGEIVPVKGCKEAELTKLLENTFRHVNIALVNELSVFAHQLDIDVWNAIDAAATKPFGFMKFTPGPGVGGHCLPIDPSYLSWKVKESLGRQFRFVELANDVNEHMPDYTVSRLVLGLNDRFKSVKGSRVLLVGLAYKKNSSDARESPAIRVAHLLLELGATIEVVDPFLDQVPRGLSGVSLVSESEISSREYDAAVILTDHDSFDYSEIVRNIPYIFDARHRLDEATNVEFL
jgi:UDP-N-acetyl-D-mannosaminuronic acid dehydrogenase/UDP-N-acetyl-D-glucosamine dehydrogenase